MIGLSRRTIIATEQVVVRRTKPPVALDVLGVPAACGQRGAKDTHRSLPLGSLLTVAPHLTAAPEMTDSELRNAGATPNSSRFCLNITDPFAGNDFLPSPRGACVLEPVIYEPAAD